MIFGKLRVWLKVVSTKNQPSVHMQQRSFFQELNSIGTHVPQPQGS